MRPKKSLFLFVVFLLLHNNNGNCVDNGTSAQTTLIPLLPLLLLLLFLQFGVTPIFVLFFPCRRLLPALFFFGLSSAILPAVLLLFLRFSPTCFSSLSLSLLPSITLTFPVSLSLCLSVHEQISLSPAHNLHLNNRLQSRTSSIFFNRVSAKNNLNHPPPTGDE